MPLGITTSKAEIRSLATKRRLSPRSKISRTLPVLTFWTPGRSTCKTVLLLVMGGKYANSAAARQRFSELCLADRDEGLLKKWKEPFQFSLIRPPAILADFECLRVTDGIRFVGAIEFDEFRAKAFGLIAVAAFKMAADLAMPLFLFFGIAGNEGRGTVGATLIEL